jgi:hypothetical protein
MLLAAKPSVTCAASGHSGVVTRFKEATSMFMPRQSRFAAPVAILVILSFVATLLPSLPARADLASLTAPIPFGSGGADSLSLPPPPADSEDELATTNLATGAAQTTFRFDLPTARGDVQPSLSLQYSSSAGVGFGGVGWNFNTPSITRKGPSGLPLFQDLVLTSPGALKNAFADDYYANGQLLVPICPIAVTGNAATCSSGGPLLPGEVLPAAFAGTSAQGWVYFRREVDDGARYFFSPNGQTWAIQTKSGHLLQLGHPLDGQFISVQSTGEQFVDGTEHPNTFTVQDAMGGQVNAVYRWDLVRESDATGNNTVYYAWTDNHFQEEAGTTLPNINYLSDI